MVRRSAAALVLVCLTGVPAVAESSAPASITKLVARVLPTVVSIETMRELSRKPDAPASVRATPDLQTADGSGFIVESSGYVATNRHVVEGGYRVTVTLSDGRTVPADVVWKSPVVDVAFLKIDIGEPLPVVSLADDQKLALGQRVIAIGNPFGLGISVSSGIVSALNRNIKQSPYDNFIQTDAAINHGSSGGPLFDENGDVIGMNSVLWQADDEGGSVGVGFAIPGSDLTFLIDQLKRNHTVRCGWLGLHGQRLTPAMGDALDFPAPYGVIVASTDADSPAAKAGLRDGDVIKALDGKVLDDVTTLNRAICPAIGKTVALDVWRDGRFIALEAGVVDGGDGTSASTEEGPVRAPRFASAADLGLMLAPISDKLRVRYHLPEGANGLAVTAVTASGAADDAGLRPGDVIMTLQMTPLSDSTSFDTTLVGYGRRGRHHVIAMVQSAGGKRWVTLPVRADP